MDKPRTTIGRVEQIQLVDLDNQAVTAKIDTGADISSIWASNIVDNSGKLSFTLFNKTSPSYTGKVISLEPSDYKLTRIANSFGEREIRYVVTLKVRLRGRLIKTSFSLADRSKKIYPVLLGRRFLYKKFSVDVSQGQPLRAVERAKRSKMQAELERQQNLNRLGDKL